MDPGANRVELSVHPRTCGEYLDNGASHVREVGSSPHVRGIPCWLSPSVTLIRFIPARAGNTSPARIPRGRGAVHPRTCGEYKIARIVVVVMLGSSPHVRGILSRRGLGNGFGRFIPARAGNTRSWLKENRNRPVHPRTCGEYREIPSVRAFPAGSSPHVRGIQLRAGRIPIPIRFIPARAGNTAGAHPAARALPVHPRTCGEY